MGYDGILFGRLDYQEKEQRTAQKTQQMIWKVNENGRKFMHIDHPINQSYFLAENERWLFTGILPNLYHPPETLGLKSDVIGSLLVSIFYHYIDECLPPLFSDLRTRIQYVNQQVVTANVYSKNWKDRLEHLFLQMKKHLLSLSSKKDIIPTILL